MGGGGCEVAPAAAASAMTSSQSKLPGGPPIAFVNGKRHALPAGKAECTLLEWLREIGLTGTKLGCGEGGCGACTVMVSRYDAKAGRVVHRAVNACLFPLYAIDSCQVTTVEGIGSKRGGMHPVQKRLAESHGSQCGFCTPGFVMSMYALLRSKEGGERPTPHEVEECLGGNLCRCTGYRPILEAFQTFSKGNEQHFYNGGGAENGKANGDGACALGDACCKRQNGKQNGNGVKTVPASSDDANGSANDAVVSEPIFPSELRKRAIPHLTLPGPKASWHRPTTLTDLLRLARDVPEAKLVSGNSEVGIEMRFKHAGYRNLVSPAWVPDLLEVTALDGPGNGNGPEGAVAIGAAVTLTGVMEALAAEVAALPPHATSTHRAVLGQLKWFAGSQIRNVATIAGNIATGSPISDLNPIWMASGTTFGLVRLEPRTDALVERRVRAEGFFLGYRKVDLMAAQGEIIRSIEIPRTRPLEYVHEFKQAHRREDDISIVCAGMRVRFEAAPGNAGGLVVAEIALAYGGVAAKTVMAPKTQAMLVGRPWDRTTLELATKSLAEEIHIAQNAPGGMPEFRRSLVTSFFFKFFARTSLALASDPHAQAAGFAHALGADEVSAGQPYERPASKGVQVYDHERSEQIVGKPIPHAAADLQVTGEAQYLDDIPKRSDELYGALVVSDRPHAMLLDVDASEALAMPGVAGFFGAKDIPAGGSNWMGPGPAQDEECFATDRVTCVGQVIGIVVAETEAQARDAARAVVVSYEDLPHIVSLKDAVAKESFYPAANDSHVARGDVDACFGTLTPTPEPGVLCNEATGMRVVEGEVHIGGQDHFYLETHGCMVVPVEHDELLMYASTQAPEKNQKVVSKVLGLRKHKVVCKAKRIGGGFGGKETRNCWLNAAIAVPAFLLQRPVRLCLSREEDMQMTGHRHPFLGRYRVGFDDEGCILALDCQLFNNGGNTMDLSRPVMQRAVLHADNCYRIPHVRIHGKVCKTHSSSNTAFRGFGGPQGMMVTEAFVDHVARTLGIEAERVREINLYRAGDVIPCGMTIEGDNIQRTWHELKESASFDERKAEVAAFNAKHKYRKRGIALVPTKFGIAFTLLYYNQGGALVHIYTDGTVLVTHGGIEMGQGLHTKCCQIAADAFKIPVSSVYISETSTDKVPNAAPTAASSSTDLYGSAVLNACEQLNARLEKYRAACGEGASFGEIATKAHEDRCDLSAHGFYKTPLINGYGGDRPFLYFTYGTACSEVEIDTLTGDFQAIRTDILMDVGKSINPGLDVGQIEGGFAQGLGLMTLEELVWGDEEHTWVKPGTLLTRGPGNYKIPSVNDIPQTLNVSLLSSAPNPHAIASSKAIGEPPLFLASSVFYAIKEAICAARKARGEEGYFALQSPATPERIRGLV